MTALGGVAGDRPRDDLGRITRETLDAQSLYSNRPARILTVAGASFGAALHPTTPEELYDRQPLQAGSVVLVADARIDNRDDLIAALADPAVTPEATDSDIVLAGWNRWKHSLLERLAGSFAFAVFDVPARAVILVRGPAGDRPLCYRLEQDCLRFASMPSGLVDGQYCPNLPGLARLIVHRDFELGETAFRDVRTVPPGHFLEWSAGGHRIVRFWYPPVVDETPRRDAIEQFRSILDQSVGSRLRRVAGPIAAHLSSGFDSSAVTATAASLVSDRSALIAYTMIPAPGVPISAPRGRQADESSLAAETAGMLRINHKTVFAADALLDSLRGHARVYQAPVPNVPNQGWGEAIDRLAAETGAKVLLSATQGNASISFGNIDLLAEWLRRGRLVGYFRQANALVRSGSARWRGAIFYSIDDFVPKKIWNRLAGYLPETAADLFVSEDWMRRVAEDRIGSNYDAPGLRRSQYAIYANTDFGIYTKGTLGRFGLDERDPTADTRLIEFCLRLPARCYLDRGITKRLAREGLADRLPRLVIDNRVRGYQGADWFAKLEPRNVLEWIEEIAASSAAAEIVDLAALRRAVGRWDRIAQLPPFQLRQWGNRFTRALSVGAFLREAEGYATHFGRKV